MVNKILQIEPRLHSRFFFAVIASFTLVSMCLCLSANAFAAKAHRQADPIIESIVVMPVKFSADIDATKAKMINEVPASELTKIAPAGLRILSSDDIKTLLNHDKSRVALGCDETGCLVEIGQALGASHLMQISLARFGQQYVVNSKVLDVNKSAALFRHVDKVEASDEALLKSVHDMVTALALQVHWKSAEQIAQAESPQTPQAESGLNAGPLFWGELAVATLSLGASVALGVLSYVGQEQAARMGSLEKAQNASWLGLSQAAGATLTGLLSVAGFSLAGLQLFSTNESQVAEVQP